MAYRQSTVDEGKIARLQKEGRGLGRGAEYKPWLMIYDLPSKGRSHRVFGTKTRRIHHFLSDIEWRLFLHLDWCDEVADIREQFPLDRLVTRQIATSMGVRHPTDTGNKTPLVMTTDFLVDVLQEGKLRQEACAVKPSADLKRGRVLEKLEIERRYWIEKGVSYRIVTDLDFSPIVTKNLQWLRTLAFTSQSEPWAGFHRDQAEAVLQAIPLHAPLTLRQFCARMDQDLELSPGSTLTLVRHLLLSKIVAVDLTRPLNDHRSMADFLLRSPVAGREVG